MANFTPFKFTSVGLDLEYNVQAGKLLNFSKFVLGDGNYTGSIRDLINVVNPIREEPITRFEIIGASNKKRIRIGFDLDTTKITTGFYLREIGLFAKDPDTDEDILMFYTNAGDTADYISNNTSNTVTTKLINAEVYITDVAEITATIDDSLVFALANETYTKSQIDEQFARLASAYIFKGSVATENDLPTEGMQVGDVYDIQETNMNVAWNGTEWDDLGGVFEFDLTEYAKKAELSTVATSGSYNDLNDKPDIPTSTSELINDSNFKSITASPEDLEPGVSELAEGHIHLTYE